ncbi:MAG: hypothetical protein BJ554DRAFT_8242 [Olpidium bornovanus]|uniref:Uncharacterized protein n=1 Tax=Olpidium bornovanus TaxID=278681 RepID=A0A8H8DIR2_9FUNG|nr:MAG: hypothetical protein BJ554DRAFT_8242 [Olpidium bornovanus]
MDGPPAREFSPPLTGEAGQPTGAGTPKSASIVIDRSSKERCDELSEESILGHRDDERRDRLAALPIRRSVPR